jgi:hypothetical protein
VFLYRAVDNLLYIDNASSSVKIHLEHYVVFIDKATITKTANSTRITTDYAKFTNTE